MADGHQPIRVHISAQRTDLPLIDDLESQAAGAAHAQALLSAALADADPALLAEALVALHLHSPDYQWGFSTAVSAALAEAEGGAIHRLEAGGLITRPG
jgi:hypothetical protein